MSKGTIQQVNEALKLLHVGTVHISNDGTWFCENDTGKKLFSTKLRKTHHRFSSSRSFPGYGHTYTNCVVHLVLWLRDEPRYGIGALIENIGGDCKFTDYLSAAGYDDPAKTCCVLCKKVIDIPGDWWYIPGRIDQRGPCHYYGDCSGQEKKAS